MLKRYEEETRPLKWWTYAREKRDAIMREFWDDYFEKFPEPGSMPELNTERVIRGLVSPQAPIEKPRLTYAEFLKSRSS